MHVRAERDLDGSLNDIARFAGGYLITTGEGRVELLDDTLATIRVLREADDMLPGGIVAIDHEIVVLVGWESVSALELASGKERWGIYDGDHSIDEDFSDCLARVGDYVMLPSGGCVRFADGAYLPWEKSPGHHDCVLVEHDAILVGDAGVIGRWTPATQSVVEIMRLASPAHAIARAPNDELVVACVDGSVHFAERCIVAPHLAPNRFYYRIALTASPRLAVVQFVQDLTSKRRWQLFVDDERVHEEATEAHGHVDVEWVGHELAVIMCGALRGTDITNISLSRRFDDVLVIADGAGKLRVIAADQI
jgi:hypothetical protein